MTPNIYRLPTFLHFSKMDPAKLRNFRVGRAFRAMGIATIVSTAVTGVVVYMYNKKEIATARKFYQYFSSF